MDVPLYRYLQQQRQRRKGLKAKSQRAKLRSPARNRYHNPKTVVAVADAGSVEGAVSRPTVPRKVVPRTAPQHTDVTTRFVDPRTSIHWRALVTAMPVVFAPFPHVAVHVVQAKGIRFLLPHRMDCLLAVLRVPGDLIQTRLIVSRMVANSRPRPARILPLRFTRYGKHVQKYGGRLGSLKEEDQLDWSQTEAEHRIDLREDMKVVQRRLEPMERAICKELASGKSRAQIVKSLGVSRHHLDRLIDEIGYQMRTAGREERASNKRWKGKLGSSKEEDRCKQRYCDGRVNRYTEDIGLPITNQTRQS